MTKQEVLKLPFNIERHNAHFINYCEVVVYPDGKVEYATPSHQEKMIEIYAKKHNITNSKAKEIFYDDIDFFDKILDDTGIVLVWYNNFQFTKINKTQIEVLNLMKVFGCIRKEILDLRRVLGMICLTGMKDTLIILDKDRNYHFDYSDIDLCEQLKSRNISIMKM